MSGRVALVTGGGRGIGSAIALELASRGNNVAISYNRSENEAMKICEKMSTFGVKSLAVKCNVTFADQVEALFSEIEKELGPVEILVNNAGVTRDNLLMRMKDDDWDSVISANLTSVYRCSKQALKKMVKARWGRIINISSVVGLIGNPGIIGFSKAIAREYGGRGITVNAIAPGFIETDMTAILKEEIKQIMLSQIPLNRVGTPEDIAKAAAFFASDDAAYITGQVLSVDGGM